MRGADVLEKVVYHTHTDGLGDAIQGISMSYVAKVLTGEFDGRKISAKARKLQAAGLVTIERQGDTTFLKPTERGLEVDATLERITAARGGEFLPWKDTDMTISEKTALHA
jgi:hypothetical protein